MRVLSYLEIQKIGGSEALTKEAAFDSMAHYSLLSLFAGGSISTIYALCTNTTVVTTTVGSKIVIASSFPTVFWMGLGISSVIGAGIGLGVAAYNANNL